MRLAIIICTYNNADLLGETLRHIAAQQLRTPEDLAVLVVANNCTDNTVELVEEFRRAGNIPHLRVVNELQQGQAHARQRGVEECADAEWIAFVDDDNYLSPEWVQRALDYIAEHPRCGAFGGRVEILWEEQPSAIFETCAYAYAKLDLGPEPLLLTGETRWRLKGAGLVCRRSALVETGWVEWQKCVGRSGGSTMSGDDLEIVMRIAQLGYEIRYTPACHLRHFITRRRLTFAYLRRLHYGFGLAHVPLLNFKRARSPLMLAAVACASCAQQLLRTLRRLLAAPARLEAHQRAVLDLEYLRGAVAGFLPCMRSLRQPPPTASPE
jgi:glycosyltransferase involved in cell wall biosynthesis